MRWGPRRSPAYSGVSFRPAATTASWRSPSRRRAPVRAIFSRSEPSDWRSHCSWARYCNNPLARIAMAVRRRKLAPRRQPSRRQTGSRTFMTIPASCGTLLVHGQLGDVALEEQLHGPVEDHAEAGGERRKLQHVDGLPQNPRRKPGQLEPAEIGDRGPPAKRDHLAQQPERERPPLAPAELGGQLARQRAPLAEGDLGRRRIELAGVGINLGGAATLPPRPGMAMLPRRGRA